MAEQIIAYCEFDPASPGPFTQYLLPHIAAQARREPERFAALGAVWREYAVGAAAVRLEDPEQPEPAVLESLFVDPQARGQGAGAGLLRRAAEAARRRGAKALSVSYALSGAELEAFDRMVRAMGAEPAFHAPVYTIDSAAFHDSPALGAAFSPDYVPPPQIVPFSRLSAEQRQALDAREDVPEFVAPAGRGRLLDEALSLAWVENGAVAGFVLGCESAPGSFTQLGVWRAQDAPQGCFRALQLAHVNLCYYYGGGDFLYHLSAVTERSEELVQRVTGGKYRRLEEHLAYIGLDASDGE